MRNQASARHALPARRPEITLGGHVRRLLTVVVLALLAVGAAVMAPAQATTLPALTGVRTGGHATYDRVVFDFSGGKPSEVSVGWVSQLISDPKGDVVPVASGAILRVTMRYVNSQVPLAKQRAAYALKDVITTVQAGNFEGVVTYGIGVLARTPYSTFRLTSPDRFVVDFTTTSLPTVSRKVYFVDNGKIQNNIDPPVTAVWRQVLAASPATGVMNRLYSGPTAAEKASGLGFVASKSTGFTKLRIDQTYRIARVQLVGGCSSGGSAVATVATEIFPSLKQFSTVDWVKIYDPSGNTEQPYGQVDSIPECLEP